MILTETSRHQRGIHLWGRSADRTAVRRGARLVLHADVRSDARANVLESRWASCRYGIIGHRRPNPALYERRGCTFRRRSCRSCACDGAIGSGGAKSGLRTGIHRRFHDPRVQRDRWSAADAASSTSAEEPRRDEQRSDMTLGEPQPDPRVSSALFPGLERRSALRCRGSWSSEWAVWRAS